MSGVVGDRLLDGPHGDLRVRVYEPASGVDRVAGLVWAHGGAFMHGDLDMPEADWVARRLADVGVVVVSVDYRLAPDLDYRDPPGPGSAAPDGVRFPVASEEVTFAYGWARDAGLGVGPERWSLGGASAGGNLAAGASLRLRDAGGPQPRSIVLAYPVAHYELPAPSPELAEKIAALPPDRSFPPEAMRAMGANYLGGSDLPISPYAHPGGQDLRGLPPTFVVTSDHDALPRARRTARSSRRPASTCCSCGRTAPITATSTSHTPPARRAASRVSRSGSPPTVSSARRTKHPTTLP
ncbi:alpha/beta hydrolase fold domain-containing protein [Promicromonospora sp. NPDC060271]|uniref:alpha/beta hydrolase fold domain-containing protein n=1 Tax=Promicromonospora sp. NPDC060271 TaxID=3347089 RepID=UPI003651A0C2